MNTKTSFSSVTSSEDYKKTEVGLLPIDWGVAEFGDLVSYKKGFAFKSSTYEKVGVRVIRVSDTTFTDIKDEEPIFVSEKLASQCSAWGLRANDLIFTTVGSKPPMYDSLVGKAILVTEKHDGSLLNQNAVRIRAKASTKGIQTYLLNHFRTERYIEFIEMIYRGNANQASITLQNLFEFKIPLPSSETEQTAIANALSDVDALIQELEKLIAKKQAIKTATMQQLLTGRTRLPAFGFEKSAQHPDGRKKGYKPSELGEIPEDWEVIGFGSLFQPTVSKKAIKPNSLVSFVGMQDVTEQAQLSSQHLVTIENVKSGFTYFERGDVLVAKITPCFENGKGCHTESLQTEIGFGSTEFHVLRATDNSDAKFIYYWSNRDIFRRELESEMVGSAGHRRVPFSAIAHYLIPVPQKEEQTAIATILGDMDKEIQSLEQRLNKTRQIKQGMMQELLTGKTRLVKPAEPA